MDIIIMICALVIAIAIGFGKPLNIKITHEHVVDAKEHQAPPTNLEDLEMAPSMDSAIKTLNEVMGVFADE